MTIGSVEPMKKLHERWGGVVQFVDVLTRQAHPGPEATPYDTFEQKMRDGRRYKDEEDIPWTVLVDEVDGSTHQVYWGLPDPTYLIDSECRVAYYNMWTHVPTLHRAIQALFAQAGNGVVMGGVDRSPHLLPALAGGWPGLRRGLPQSYIDLETAVPGMGSLTWLGYRMRPVLAPIALRAEPLPTGAKIALGIGGAAIAALTARRLSQA